LGFFPSKALWIKAREAIADDVAPLRRTLPEDTKTGRAHFCCHPIANQKVFLYQKPVRPAPGLAEPRAEGAKSERRTANRLLGALDGKIIRMSP
jgi:hypothetical protein